MVMHAEDVEESGFTGAGWTHDGNEIAFCDLKVDIAQNIK
jgi:hypothetical protein